MNKQTNSLDWETYARKYDMLLHYNPFYQQLQREVQSLLKEWELPPAARIADLGAGTGNYSIILAQLFPEAAVLHIDKNGAMNLQAMHKKRRLQLDNLDIRQQGIDDVELPANSLDALVSVHALYAFPDPPEALRSMYQWLKPGGRGILIDPGRVVNVWKWQWAIGTRLLRQYGLRKTLEIFREARTVSVQNRYIRQLQRRGQLWTHSPEEFRAAVQEAGFTILESRTCFRGLSDMAVVTKT